MIKIDYPSYQPKIKKQQGKEFIFDEVRKQWTLLTPEEWVRQNFLQYLLQVKKYPAALIVITNGSHCYGFSASGGILIGLNELPEFNATI